MIFENTSVWGFEHAFRGMRNPKESWENSDSFAYSTRGYHIGANDMKLAKTLIKSGPSHRKFLRQIMVSVDISAPLYWWKEFDTYKVGTVSNSCSTMHKLASTPIKTSNFELLEDWDSETKVVIFGLVDTLESLRKKYNESKDEKYWKELIQLLPESWIQKRTVTMDYETLYSIARPDGRRNHKLSEWSTDFMAWMRRELPYAKELIFADETDQ